MERDLQVHTEAVDRLWDELTYVVEYLRSQGFTEIDVLFGFAWYVAEASTELSWRRTRIPLNQVIPEIKGAEAAGLGNFARDDVSLSIENAEFRFCHHSGVHLFYSSPGPLTQHFHHRWQILGLNPSEWTKEEGSREWRQLPDSDGKS